MSLACSSLSQLSITSSTTHKQTGPFLGGWVCVHSRTLWVSPTISPVRLVGSPIVSTAKGFFQSEVLRVYFPALEPWVAWSVSFPSCSSWFIHSKCGTTHAANYLLACPAPPAAALPRVLSVPAAISASPTSLNECFFFNSLVVRLPFSSIFWQF